jgi:hypothetical protein
VTDVISTLLVEIVESALLFDAAGPDDVAIDALFGTGVVARSQRTPRVANGDPEAAGRE